MHGQNCDAHIHNPAGSVAGNHRADGRAAPGIRPVGKLLHRDTCLLADLLEDRVIPALRHIALPSRNLDDRAFSKVGCHKRIMLFRMIGMGRMGDIPGNQEGLHHIGNELFPRPTK